MNSTNVSFLIFEKLMFEVIDACEPQILFSNQLHFNTFSVPKEKHEKRGGVQRSVRGGKYFYICTPLFFPYQTDVADMLMHGNTNEHLK